MLSKTLWEETRPGVGRTVGFFCNLFVEILFSFFVFVPVPSKRKNGRTSGATT